MRLATDVPLKLSVARGNVMVGISGWSYAPWRGNFFPNGLPQKLELAFAARRFGALEVNGTFYSLQRPSTFTSWYNQTPPGFIFALKGGRYITHMRKLREPLASLANFFASGPFVCGKSSGQSFGSFRHSFTSTRTASGPFLIYCHVTRSRWLAWHESMMIESKAASFLKQMSAGRFVTRSSFATIVFLTIVFFQCCAITGFHWW